MCVTVKQLLIGSVVMASAYGAMVAQAPRHQDPLQRPTTQRVKIALRRPRAKQIAFAQAWEASLEKIFFGNS